MLTNHVQTEFKRFVPWLNIGIFSQEQKNAQSLTKGPFPTKSKVLALWDSLLAKDTVNYFVTWEKQCVSLILFLGTAKPHCRHFPKIFGHRQTYSTENFRLSLVILKTEFYNSKCQAILVVTPLSTLVMLKEANEAGGKSSFNLQNIHSKESKEHKN